MPDTSSHVLTLITNLKLLDLDLLDDWPCITLQKLSAHNAPRVQMQRIRCVEWALYRLFERWDPEETTNKLQPFFPPLEPLQSLNLRAAIFRCLNDLKKRNLLGRDITLRKTMLDECKGDKVEELLGAFSTLVLKKVVAAEASNRDCSARRLGLARKLGPRDRKMLASIVTVHRASLTTQLRRKAELKSRLGEFNRILKVKKQELDRKAQSLLHTNINEASPTGIEGEAVRRSILRATIKHKKDIGRQWTGDSTWVTTILKGPKKGDAHNADDSVLDASFDHVWSRFVHGSLIDNKHQSNSVTVVLQDLEDRVARQQGRLQRWRTLRKDLDHINPSHSSATNDKKHTPGAFHSIACKQQKARGHQEAAAAARVEVKNMSEVGSETLGAVSNARRTSDARTAHRGALTTGHVSVPSAEQDEPVNLTRRSSTRRLPIGSERRSSHSSKFQSDKHGIPISSLAQISERTSPGLSDSIVNESDVLKHQQPSTITIRVGGSSCVDQKALPPMDEDDAMAQRIISSVINAKPSPVKVKPSLIERTRISMAVPISDIDECDEPRHPSTIEHDQKATNVKPSISSISLLERTRQSMSILPARAREPQMLRQSQSFRKTQFVTPRRQQVDSNKEESGKDSTPRELLFAEEADYASVFKSRPRIKISPISSPVPHNDSRLNGNGEDYECTVIENSPSFKVQAKN